jgi:hypothetical protein
LIGVGQLRSGAGYGTDSHGRPILVEGTRDPGSHQLYFIGGPGGQRIVIHSGSIGDADNFDPTGFQVDGERLWSVNMDGTAFWLWTEKDGLRRFPLSGVAQHDMFVSARFVGGCS